MAQKSKYSGFSLLEVVVSMFILGMVTANLFALFIVGTKFTSQSQNRIAAVGYAMRIAEKLKLYVSADPDIPTGAGSVLSVGTHSPSEIIWPNPDPFTVNGIDMTCNYTVADIDTPGGDATGMKQVVLTVTWDEPS